MGTRRTTARDGLSYYDANRHCLVEVSSEVMEYKKQAHERWPDTIDVWFDKDRLMHVVAVKETNGNWSLLFESEGFGQQELDRIERAGNMTAEELLAEIDRHNATREKEIDDQFSEAIGDAGERLLFALRQDGVTDHADIYGVKNRRLKAANRG